MKALRKALIVAIGASAVALGVATPAGADPGDDGSCPLSVSILCHFLPGATDLDHDVDLTQGGATLNGDALPQTPGGTLDTESGPPTPPCLNGCS